MPASANALSTTTEPQPLQASSRWTANIASSFRGGRGGNTPSDRATGQPPELGTIGLSEERCNAAPAAPGSDFPKQRSLIRDWLAGGELEAVTPRAGCPSMKGTAMNARTKPENFTD